MPDTDGMRTSGPWGKLSALGICVAVSGFLVAVLISARRDSRPVRPCGPARLRFSQQVRRCKPLRQTRDAAKGDAARQPGFATHHGLDRSLDALTDNILR